MKISCKQVAMGLAIVFAIVTAISAQRPANRTSQLRVVKYHGDMASLLAKLADDYDVVIGVETDQKKPNSAVTLDLREVNFHDLLNGIVQSEPRYQWRESDGSIEVLPVKNDISLMDTTINSFEVKDVFLEVAINELLSLKEVRDMTATMNLSRRPPANGPPTAGQRKVSLTLNGVTVRQALNRIIKQSGATFWIFRTYPDGTFSLGTSAL